MGNWLNEWEVGNSGKVVEMSGQWGVVGNWLKRVGSGE